MLERFSENLDAMTDVDDSNRKLEYMGEEYSKDSIIMIVKEHKIEMVKILTVFTAMDFSSNNFHGEIP